MGCSCPVSTPPRLAASPSKGGNVCGTTSSGTNKGRPSAPPRNRSVPSSRAPRLPSICPRRDLRRHRCDKRCIQTVTFRIGRHGSTLKTSQLSLVYTTASCVARHYFRGPGTQSKNSKSHGAAAHPSHHRWPSNEYKNRRALVVNPVDSTSPPNYSTNDPCLCKPTKADSGPLPKYAVARKKRRKSVLVSMPGPILVY